MAESVTPTRPLGKLDSLPKDELIKYIKKQVSQMKDLKKKNEDLNMMLKHERTALEKLEQEQKSWLSRGVSAEFEKKEELQKKERELQMAAHLGQQMLAENDKLRNRCDALEQENISLKEEMGAEIEHLDSEKETIEKTLIMIQNEYKEAKLETQKLKEALEIAAADHDKEHEKWEEERNQLKETMNELSKSGTSGKSLEQENSQSDADNIIKALQEEVEALKEQIISLESGGQKDSDEIARENQELKAKLEADSVELKAQDESLKLLRTKCQGLKSKTEELHQLVDMVSAERDESNAYSKQMGDEVKVMKEEREKMIRSQKTLKGKLEKAVNIEEELKRELSGLTSDKGELQLMVKNLQREKKTLMQSNKKLKDKVRASSTRQGSFDEGNSELPLEKENDELRKEIKLLKLKFENEEGELDSLKNSNKVLSKEREVLKEEVRSLMEKLLQREQDLNDKMVESEGDKAMVVKLQTRVDELLSTLQSLNEEKMHQETEIEELFKTHDELQIKYDKERKDKMEKETAIQSLSDELMKEKDHSMQLQEQLYSVQNAAQSCLVLSDCDTKPDEKETAWQKEVEIKCNNCNELEKQLLGIEEKLEVERKQRKVLETNFGEKVSSVDEFEANEMRIASMNDECSEEMDRLKREVDELRKEKNILEADMIKLEEKMLQEKAEEVRKNVEEKEKEVRDIAESKEEAMGKLEMILRELENQKEIVRDLRLDVERFEKDLHNAEEEKREFKSALDITKKICEEKEKECDNAMQEISILRGKELSLNEELSELKKTVVGNEQDGSNGIERYKKAYKKIKEKFNEVGNINEELKSELQAKTIVIEELRKEINESKDVLEKKVATDDGAKLNELLKVVEDKDMTIAELEAELKQCKDSDNDRELKHEAMVMVELQEKLDKHENERFHLDAEVKGLSCENEEIRTKLEKQIEANIEQKSLLDSLNAENMNLNVHAKELELKISEVLSDNERKSADLEEMSKIQSALREEEQKLSEMNVLIDGLEARKEELSVMNRHLIEEKEENEKQISTLKNDVELARNSEAEKMLYIGQLEHDLSGIKIEVSTYKMEIDELRRRMIERENEVQERDVVVSNIESARKQLEESLSNTTAEFNEQKKLLTDTLEKNESLLSMKEELSSQLNDKIRELAILENSKVEIEQKYEARNKEENLENEIKLLKEHLNKSEDIKCEFEQLQKICEEKDLKIQTCNDIMNEKEIKLETVDKELSTIRAEYKAMLNTAEIKENEISAVAEKLKLALAKIESLEEENKEKSEKVTKFKSVAVKAKKEIDSMKGKNVREKKESEEAIQALTTELQNAKEILAQQSEEHTNFKGVYDKLVNEFEAVSSDAEKKNQRNIEAENEIIKLNGSLDHLQVALASVENENATLQSHLKEKENCVIDLTRQSNESATAAQQLREELSEEKSNHDITKSKLSKVSEEFENAKKDVSQMKMISLEMDDYHRTAQALQNKLNESEIECKDGRTRIQQLEQDINELNEKIASADEKSGSLSEEIEKLATFLAQKDQEIDDLVSERKDLEEKELNFKRDIEALSAKCEERMIQISDIASEREKLVLQLKNEKDLHQKDIQTVESKYSRTRTELSLLQEAYENCKTEFEGYKIRAQNVLKQQKMKQVENDDTQSLKEKLRLEKIVEDLKEKLKEVNGRLSANLVESEDLEAEYEKLQNRYGELVKDISEKEAHWRERFIGIQSEMKTLSTESEQKISLLSQERDSLQEKVKSNEEYEVMAQDYEETIKELKEQIVRLQQVPKRQNSREKKPAIDSEVREHRSTPEHLKLTMQSVSDASHGLVERPGAEGMDSSELEIIDKSSLPATPISPDSASILDKILSPTEHQNSWPISPTTSKEEGFRLRSALSTAEKNVEHLTELLAETEGSNVRLTEQIKLLKTEIRRMQQNQEREEALHNLEYLKNVIIKFMKCNTTERECLVPVISTMLKLTTEEKQFITEFAKGEADQDPNASGWSSYVYKWTSFS